MISNVSNPVVVSFRINPPIFTVHEVKLNDLIRTESYAVGFTVTRSQSRCGRTQQHLWEVFLMMC